MEQLKTNDKKQEQRFVIKDTQSLKWTLQLMESKRKQIQANREMMQQSFDYYTAKNDKLLKDIKNWQEAINQYGQIQLQADPDWKFEDSPYGRVVQSKAKITLVQADKQALIDQFKGTQYVTQVTTDRLDWKKLKDTLKYDDKGHVVNEDGELVKGAEVKQTPAKIEIKHKNVKGNWTTKED